MDGAADPPRWTFVKTAVAVAAVLTGALVVLLAITIGHCSAFGGRCPAERPSLLDDDVFGTSFAGAILAVGVPIWVARPGWRRAGYALVAGIPAALVIALVARELAAG